MWPSVVSAHGTLSIGCFNATTMAFDLICTTNSLSVDRGRRCRRPHARMTDAQIDEMVQLPHSVAFVATVAGMSVQCIVRPSVEMFIATFH